MDKKELLYLIEQDSAFMKAFIDGGHKAYF